MKTRTIEELNDRYDLELKRIVSQIKKEKSNLVLWQFPDGLKPYATAVVDYLSEKTKAEFLIWFGTCFGACDTPAGLEKIKPKIDLVIQFGHTGKMPSYI